MNPSGLKYSKEHEWLRIESGDVGVVGITGFAASNLGDVVYVELPEVGATVTQFSKMGEIESVKAVSDLYSPITGTVTEINEALTDNPEHVNNSPFEDGWMIKVLLSDSQETSKLLTASEYEELITSEDG